jgi:ParB family transcriptional regulator, chromosome partitioning protein
MDTRRLDLELHRLDLRFAGARLVEPRAVDRIARSIECAGQIVPCIAVANPAVKPPTVDEQLVLIDGYRRVAALRRLGRDTAAVECWLCDLTEALLSLLARAQSRPLAQIEEALLLRELTQALGLSQREVARRCGRDNSWVARRLQLLTAVPDTALDAVRNGQLSSWAATRVIAPLARANAEHADRLLKALAGAQLSTRELRRWFNHYRQASRTSRERLVNHPHLFLQAAQETAEQDRSELLRDGPEGECDADLRRINVLIARLRKRLPTLRPLPETLVSAVPWLQASLQALCDDIKGYSEHDSDRDPQQRANLKSAGSEPARDQSPVEAVA